MKKIIAISGLALAVAACGGTASPASSALPTSTASSPAATPTTASAIATPTQAATTQAPVPAATATAVTASAPVTTSAAVTPATATADPLVGEWTVGLGAPSVVSITQSGSGYAITVVGGSEAMGSDCYLSAGTKFATFSASGTDTYSAEEGTWSRSASGTCSFSGWVAEKLTLATTPTYKLSMPSTDSNDPLPLTFNKA